MLSFHEHNSKKLRYIKFIYLVQIVLSYTEESLQILCLVVMRISRADTKDFWTLTLQIDLAIKDSLTGSW